MAFRRAFRHGSQGGRGDARSAVDEELAFHLEEVEEELIAGGMDPKDAHEQARRRFGDVEGTKDYCAAQQTRRQTREGWKMRLDALRQDLGFAIRTLSKSPGYATIVVLTLAVGIAANTVIFSLMNPYLFRPLPYADADELVQLGQVDPRSGWDGARFSLKMLEDYRARSRAFEGLGAYHYTFTNATGPEGPERIQMSLVTADLFDVLGARPALGRSFRPEEAGPGGERVALLEWGLWQRRWAGDPDLVGRAVTLDGEPYTVIGVMPEGFNFPFGGVKLWSPIRESVAEEERSHVAHLIVGRLRPGWSEDRARTELEGIQADLGQRHPEVDGRYAGMSVKGIREALNFAWEVLTVGFAVLLGAVAFVLTIACVNVAGLTLARAHGRGREVAIRAAIGAGRGRIVRQLLTESLLLALAGGILGVLAAYWTTGVLGPLLPEDLFKVGTVSIDGRVLAFSLAVTLLTPLVFGLVPALKVARTELADSLREGGRGNSGGLGALRGRRALVLVELVLAVILVTGTGLMIRSFDAVRQIDLGFDPDRVLTVESSPPRAGYDSDEEVQSYFAEATRRLSALPGVEAVGQVAPLPLNHESGGVSFALPGEEPSEADAWPRALFLRADPGFLDGMGVDLVAGRGFRASDGAGGPDGPLNVLVSRQLAQRHFGGRSPVGQTLLIGPETRRPGTVVGVVGDVAHSGLGSDEADLHVYFPQAENPTRRRFLVLKTRGAPAELVQGARRTMLELDANIPVTVRPMEEIVLENTYQWTLSSLFLGIFGTVAVALASLGIYGVISYSVTQRRKELGVRMAMGADRSHIRRLVLRQGFELAAVGGLVGLVLAAALARVVSSFLYGVSPFDPVTLGGVGILFLGVALAASIVPAQRAMRVSPVKVLKQE